MTSSTFRGIRAPSATAADGAPSAGLPASRQHMPDRRNASVRARIVPRILGEFHEVPGLCLTLAQASRLFGLSAESCARVFDRLIADGLLTQGPDGRYKLR